MMLVDTVPRPVQIAAFHRVQAWSTFDASTKRYGISSDHGEAANVGCGPRGCAVVANPFRD